MKKDKRINKADLLNKLEKVEYAQDGEKDEALMSNLSVAKSILNLAGINHEKEYLLTKKVAERLLDKLPSIDDIV